MKSYAARMSVCPRRGCGGQPLPIFCLECWVKVSHDTRRKLLSIWKAMARNRHGAPASPPDGFVRLLETAVKEINAAPPPRLNVAERLTVALHAAVVGASP